jgi:glucose/arabinose dehydrogenase
VFQAGKPGGGTGIAVQRDVLFVEVEGRIARYVIGREALVPRGGEAIVTGMPLEGDHPMHTFAVSADGGSLYVNSGSASNACQEKNRELESPGKKPCPELPTRAGIWRFDAKKTGQTFTAASRFATGARNSVGLAVDSSGTLVAAIHGRDQLSSNWPKLYTQQQNNELPAETLVRVGQGDDFGWPYCYYDAKQAKLLLAPEYGGDGGKSQGECASKKAPDLAFPAHWAPEAIAFYGASAFPEKYRGGAFVTFHGSWDRKPVQSGFLVAFVPWAGGKPAGSYEEFATGFAGPQLPADPKKARYRPMGIAVSPDGALFVSDDVTGRIWRIVASGPV